MDDRSIILGIDVGSASISVAEITLQKRDRQDLLSVPPWQYLRGPQKNPHDGTSTNKNEAIIPYLTYLKKH